MRRRHGTAAWSTAHLSQIYSNNGVLGLNNFILATQRAIIMKKKTAKPNK